MGKTFDKIEDDLKEWIEKQLMFFVASAPTVGAHVNVSPKGYAGASLTILSPTKCAYIDMTGSGCETTAHLYDNGRITLMFNSFEKSPRILRIFGKGTVVEVGSPRIPELLEQMGKTGLYGYRSIIVVDVFKVTTSCGFAVPLLDKTSERGMVERNTLMDVAMKTETLAPPGAMAKYQAEVNAYSLDGLPGLRAARRLNGERLWVAELKYTLKKAISQWEAVLFALGVGIVLGGSASHLSNYAVLFLLPFFSFLFLNMRK